MHAEGSDAFHIARSRYLDAMAEFEAQVVRILRLGGLKAGSECLGQKLEKLASLKATCSLSKDAVKKAHDIVAGSGSMLDERNDIVHAVMRIVNFDGVTTAYFSNNRLDESDTSSVGRLINAAQFEQIERRTRSQTTRLASIGKPTPPAKKAPANADAPIKLISTHA